MLLVILKPLDPTSFYSQVSRPLVLDKRNVFRRLEWHGIAHSLPISALKIQGGSSLGMRGCGTYSCRSKRAHGDLYLTDGGKYQVQAKIFTTDICLHVGCCSSKKDSEDP